MTNFITELAAKALQGEQSALSAYIELKQIEASLKQALEAVSEAAYQEADRYSEKTIKLHNAEVTKKSSAGRWDYSHIPQHNSAKERLKAIEEMAKQAAANAKRGTTVIDNETGEVIEPATYTDGKTILSVKLITQ
jgi:ribosomal protein L22